MDGEGDLTPGEGTTARSRWPARAQARGRPSSFRYLLDLDDDLADEFDVRMRLVARPAATAFTFEAGPGEIALSEWLVMAAGGPGVLVLDGVLAANVQRRRPHRRRAHRQR